MAKLKLRTRALLKASQRINRLNPKKSEHPGIQPLINRNRKEIASELKRTRSKSLLRWHGSVRPTKKQKMKRKYL